MSVSSIAEFPEPSLVCSWSWVLSKSLWMDDRTDGHTRPLLFEVPSSLWSCLHAQNHSESHAMWGLEA